MCRVFSVEMHGGGRKYIASTYTEFWRRYSALPPGLRHHYEIVRENAPCHLYFGAPCCSAAPCLAGCSMFSSDCIVSAHKRMEGIVMRLISMIICPAGFVAIVADHAQEACIASQPDHTWLREADVGCSLPPHSVLQIWSSRRLQTRIWPAWAISWWTPSWSSPQSCCSETTS